MPSHSSLAPAEVTQKDGVRVSVQGKLAPNRLPRAGTAPVAVSVSGHIVPTKPGALPKLQRISIALNSHGHLQSQGIPVCRLGHISPSTTAQALAACRPSLVGEGRFSADVKIPEQSPFPSKSARCWPSTGALEASRSSSPTSTAPSPVPTSYVLSFAIEPSKGTYGTVLEASLPQVTGEWGYVTGVSLHLQPRYLSAGCPAPKGFPGSSSR